MKKILAILLYFFSVMPVLLAQSPYWARSAASINTDEALDITIDASNNTYTTGYFGGTATFATGVTLTSNGANDIFVEKVNDQGVFQWAVKAGGNGPDRGTSIKADAQGNCYVTGFYYGTATFGSTTITSVGGSQDVFIAKYNTNGVLQWVVSAGGTGTESGNGINIDNSGNVVVTGQFTETALFGITSLTSMIDPSTSLPSLDVFTTKLDASGNFLWAKKGSAKYTDRALDVATDLTGNIYVTGQFSDTITFDVTHNNNMYNAIFLIKYNSSGAEQWFRKIGGSTMNISYGIAVDANSNVYLTGDFIGGLTFFGTPDVQLTNVYQNDIFVAKYNTAGDFLWGKADGSVSDVSSHNIALDDSSNAYIVGNFRCTFSEYADVFGQGTFNSVGYKDIFVTKYNTNGQRQWMRQAGGQKEDFGAGIAVNSFRQAVIAGSFVDKVFFPASNNFAFPNFTYFPFYINSAYNGPYCADNFYGNYCCINSLGYADILIAKAIDLNRQPYDYYTRSSGSCVRPYVGSCINDQSYIDNVCGDDSIEVCGSAYLNGATNTSSQYPGTASPGPYFTWHWSTGSSSGSIYTTNSGNYSVTVTSQDGCYTSSDTVHVTVHPLPAKPPISDDVVVNTQSLYPQAIHLCYPASVLLTGTNTAPFYYWTDGYGNLIDSALSITVTTSGWYQFFVVDSFGCEISNKVLLVIDSLLIPLSPGIKLLDDPDLNDSIEICYGEAFTILIYDTITNPTGLLNCIDYAMTAWSVTPSVPMLNNCSTWLDCYPSVSGYHQINAQMIRINYCDTDTFLLSKTIYATVFPLPVVSINISGSNELCPGDTIVLTASGAPTYFWQGPGIISNPNLPNISINQPGYYVVSTMVTDSNGCSASAVANINVIAKPQPAITMFPSNGILCPFDSVMLHCTGSGTFEWYGPSGPFGANSSTVYVSIPGFYFCVVTDSSFCILNSQTVEVKVYATPFLLANPGTVLCPGGSITIQAITAPGSIVQWQPPLYGSNLTQTVSSAGTYNCHITLCGIMTDVSIVITMSNPVAEITPAGPVQICYHDSLTLTANAGMAGYQWSVPGSYNQSIVVSQSGVYTLTTTDANGCTATDNFILSISPELPPPIVSDTSICAGESITLNVISSDSVQWFFYPFGGFPFAGGLSFTTPVLTTTTIYYVQNKDSLCTSIRVPVTVTVYAPPNDPLINNNAPLCVGDTLFLSTNPISGCIYQWSGPNGFSSALQNPEIFSVTTDNTGTYSLTCLLNGCQGGTSDTTIIIYPPPLLDLGNDTTACIGIPFNLYAGSFSSYLWQDQSTNPAYPVTTNGNYTVMVTDHNGCKSKDSIAINFVDCSEIIIPNVFTPNGDGFNDFFSVYAPGSTGFVCRIYNRWGQLLAILNSYLQSWDGTVMQSGRKAPDGVYYYIIGYTDYKGVAKNDHGFFHLIR